MTTYDTKPLRCGLCGDLRDRMVLSSTSAHGPSDLVPSWKRFDRFRPDGSCWRVTESDLYEPPPSSGLPLSFQALVPPSMWATFV